MSNPNVHKYGHETRFKKGQSGNPGGRPKGRSLTALVRAELDKLCAEGSPVTKREALAARIVGQAIAGDDAMIAKVWAYEDGTPVARNEHGEPGDFEVGLDEARKVLRLKPVKRGDRAG